MPCYLNLVFWRSKESCQQENMYAHLTIHGMDRPLERFKQGFLLHQEREH